MKKHFLALSAFVAISTIGITSAQAGVSVSIGQPGFYGQLDIGDYYPRPQVLYADPRVIYVEPAYRYAQPIYLRVPPGHAKRWSNYCGRYNACGRPVYFVQDNWYQNVYAPRYQDYRQRGDDGRRYDRDYWSRNDDRHDHDDRRDGRANDGRGNWNHPGNGPDRHQGHGSNNGGHDKGGYDRGGNDRGGKDKGGNGKGHGRD